MAVLSRQPVGRIAINRGNKFAKRSLAFVHVGASNNNTNVVTGAFGTGAGVSRVITTKGRAIAFPNTGGQGLSFGTGIGPLLGTKQTVLVFADARARGTQRNCTFNVRSASGQFYGASFNASGDLNILSGAFSFGWADNITNAGGHIANAITGKVSAYALSRNGSSFVGSVDGQTKQVSFQDNGGANTSLGFGINTLETKVGDLGGFSGTGYGAQDPVLLTLAFNDAFTQDELNELAANPWQVLQQDPIFPYAALASAVSAFATPAGVSVSSAVGSIVAAGQGRTSPAGVSAAASVGSVIASGKGAALPAGVSAAASIGTVSATGATVINATASPAGVSAAAAVGSPAASGAANSAATGVSAVASVGAVSASGATVINGSASPVGVSAASAVGAPAASGTASAAPAGVSASASVGSVSASGATVVHGNAAPAGVAASSAVGSVAANGTARATPIGVQASAAVGTVSANGGVSVSGNAQPAGVAAVASVGTPSASGATVVHGNASAAGVAAAASVGTVAVSASARAMPAGVSVLATIGQPIASGQIQVNGTALPAGVVAYTYVGQVTASSMTFARAPAGPGYSRPFTNTTRPHQANTRRTR